MKDKITKKISRIALAYTTLTSRSLTKYLALFLAAILTTLVAGQGEATPIQWTTDLGGNGHYYELFTVPKSWTDASLSAISTGGYLATVTSELENKFIYNNLVSSVTSAWLGGYQDPLNPAYSEPSGGWVWMTGESFAYTNWGLDSCCIPEPSNTPSSYGQDLGGYEDHLAMFGPGARSGEWFDIHNIAQLYYVVESETTPIPEPATIGLLAMGLAGLAANLRRRGKVV